MSRLVLTILAAVAEAERDRIRERIAEVKRDRRGRGRSLGGRVPFGFAVGAGGELVEVPGQREAIRTMVELRRGGAPLRAIAGEVRRRHRVALPHMAVRRVLADAPGERGYAAARAGPGRPPSPRLGQTGQGGGDEAVAGRRRRGRGPGHPPPGQARRGRCRAA